MGKYTSISTVLYSKYGEVSLKVTVPVDYNLNDLPPFCKCTHRDGKYYAQVNTVSYLTITAEGVGDWTKDKTISLEGFSLFCVQEKLKKFLNNFDESIFKEVDGEYVMEHGDGPLELSVIEKVEYSNNCDTIYLKPALINRKGKIIPGVEMHINYLDNIIKLTILEFKFLCKCIIDMDLRSFTIDLINTFLNMLTIQEIKKVKELVEKYGARDIIYTVDKDALPTKEIPPDEPDISDAEKQIGEILDRIQK